MSSLYFSNIQEQHTGLCNQLNSILSTICLCINREKIIVIDKFLQEINTNNYLPISSVINLEKTNLFLEKYNIALIDGNFTDNLNIINAKYGNNNIYTDVTNIVKQFLKNNKLLIKKNINLNNLFGDNQPNVEKQLKIIFELNKFNQFTMSFHEKNNFLINDINIDFKNKNYLRVTCWDLIDSNNFKNITTDIYKNLHFHDCLIDNSNKFIEKLNLTDTDLVNVIHLRLENDAITHWSTANKLNHEDFYIKLSQKYIKLINNFIKKDDKTIILTYNPDNPVIDYLKNNNFNYFIHNKIKNNNREVNAIIDIINSKKCNNVFIAVGGSSFSWTISKIINPIQIEWLDINNINL
jgi:hypothetical protein